MHQRVSLLGLVLLVACAGVAETPSHLPVSEAADPVQNPAESRLALRVSIAREVIRTSLADYDAGPVFLLIDGADPPEALVQESVDWVRPVRPGSSFTGDEGFLLKLSGFFRTPDHPGNRFTGHRDHVSVNVWTQVGRRGGMSASFAFARDATGWIEAGAEYGWFR